MRQSKEYTVLYVDDERANLRSFKSAFRRIYNVIIADSPLEGIEIIKENKINIVVSDHRMPELIGTDFLRKVYEHDGNIRRIILSGFVKKEDLQEANEEFGIHAYISKPWDFDHLQGIFERLLTEEKSEHIIYD
ncbi:response regulator [Marinoscillum sp. 108]|uniref:Response regulator n=1 Tax=Marinoscillum luteum TaxID=861051 RepID=A0ABW7N5V6_9BACT|nr:response regulator [Marinoscillum sp. 108]VXD12837.1 Response regulator receiver domain-containing protein [Marinoscillum sp. 108]